MALVERTPGTPIAGYASSADARRLMTGTHAKNGAFTLKASASKLSHEIEDCAAYSILSIPIRINAGVPDQILLLPERLARPPELMFFQILELLAV